MSIITNEIHVLDGFAKTVIISAADRRITKPNGEYDSTRRKLLRIPYLEAGISYFGLASVYPAGRQRYMTEWLESFIRHHAPGSTIEDFAFALRGELNKVVPPAILAKTYSGFHLGGYNKQYLPEFWFITNIGGMNGFQYTDLQAEYGEPKPDFLGRDAKAAGWDGTDLRSIANQVFIYRNGDYRAHVWAWEKLDRVFAEMMQYPDFKRPQRPDDLANWVKFKLEFIANFYKQFCKTQIIGRPIDVLCFGKKFITG